MALALWLYKRIRATPGYFGIRVLCPPLANLLAGENPALKAEIKDLETGVVAQGKPSPDSSEETFFVMIAESGQDAVHVGDNLRLGLFDTRGSLIFSMVFSLLAEDIDEFCKTVTVEFLEHALQVSNAVIPRPVAEA